jgi:hypothetical protein
MGLKGLFGTNVQAYFRSASVKKEKFMTLATGTNVIKFFPSSPILGRNKLERLSLPSLLA